MKEIYWLAVPVGICLGLGLYTFHYGKGYAYLRNDPAACKNCHIMNDQYNGWIKSTHHAVATCNDCHTPANFIGKYTTKGLNGFWHSFYFTSGKFKEPIQIGPRNLQIAEENCRRCHQSTVIAMDAGHTKNNKISCTHCHQAVGH